MLHPPYHWVLSLLWLKCPVAERVWHTGLVYAVKGEGGRGDK